jgi:hypothetical protein
MRRRLADAVIPREVREIGIRLDSQLRRCEGRSGTVKILGRPTSHLQREAVALALRRKRGDSVSYEYISQCLLQLEGPKATRHFLPARAVLQFGLGSIYPSKQANRSVSDYVELLVKRRLAGRELQHADVLTLATRLRAAFLYSQSTEQVFQLIGINREVLDEQRRRVPVLTEDWAIAFGRRMNVTFCDGRHRIPAMRRAEYDALVRVLAPLLRAYGDNVSACDELYFPYCFVVVWVAYDGQCLLQVVPDACVATGADVGVVMCQIPRDFLVLFDGAHSHFDLPGHLSMRGKNTLALLSEPNAGRIASPFAILEPRMRAAAAEFELLGIDPVQAACDAIHAVCSDTALVRETFRECGLFHGCVDYPDERGLVGGDPTLPARRRPPRVLNGCVTEFELRRQAASRAMGFADLARYSAAGRRRDEEYETDRVIENAMSPVPRPLTEVFAQVEEEMRRRKASWG